MSIGAKKNEENSLTHFLLHSRRLFTRAFYTPYMQDDQQKQPKVHTQEKEMFSDKTYDALTQADMSSERAAMNEAIGSEGDDDIDPELGTVVEIPFSMTQQHTVNTSDAPNQHEYNQGEQSVSGSTPDPESDDDTLENAHNMGLQLNEDDEHPQPLNLAADIDKAEEYHRTH